MVSIFIVGCDVTACGAILSTLWCSVRRPPGVCCSVRCPQRSSCSVQCAEDSALYSVRACAVGRLIGKTFAVQRVFKDKPPRLDLIFQRSNPPVYFVTFNTHTRATLLATPEVHKS